MLAWLYALQKLHAGETGPRSRAAWERRGREWEGCVLDLLKGYTHRTLGGSGGHLIIESPVQNWKAGKVIF